MKILIDSEIHGSLKYFNKLVECYKKENCDFFHKRDYLSRSNTFADWSIHINKIDNCLFVGEKKQKILQTKKQ